MVERRTQLVLGLTGLCLVGVVIATGPRSPEASAAAVPEATADEVATAAAAETDAVPEEEPTEPPYDPLKAEGPLKGLTGAATALAIKDYERATKLSAPFTSEPEGTEKWFTVGALRGRALLASGKPADAIAELQPRWDHRRTDKHFPKELLGYELAKAKVHLAKSGTLSAEDADKELHSAIKLLSRVRKASPIRNFAQVRVLQAEAMAAIQGSTKAKSRYAAAKAATAINKILLEYPHHPRVGEFWLERGKALARAGKVKEAAAELRNISIERAGEPESELAWQELEALAAAHRSVHASPLSTTEKLQKALAARREKHVKLSREILDEVIDNPKTPGYLRSQAKSSRAYTAYKQRDYKTCVDDLLPGYERTHNHDLRGRVLRCMERGEMYDEALAIHDERIKHQKRKGLKAAIVWEAMNLAFKGGKYERAEKYLEQHEDLSTAYRQDKTWMHAWLAMRLGRNDEAIEWFGKAQRYSSDRRRAQYFEGKLLIETGDKKRMEEGRKVLTKLIEGGPLRYYALIARQRLEEAGLETPPLPKLTKMAAEETHPTRAETQAQFDALDAELGDAWPPLRRGKQLYQAGWLEEARRELRWAEQGFRTRGKKSRGPRNESFYVGLGWKGDWSYPRIGITKEGRKSLRDRDVEETLRRGLFELSRGLDEPYRMARLSTSKDGSYKARWHPRAYRAAVEREARLQKVDPIHMWSLMYTESRFRRFVVSPVGARGALQIMPWTATQLARRLGELDGGSWDTDTLFDIDTNAHLAGYYVAELLRKFHGQAPMAYASYNGGPSNVARWLAAKSKGPVELTRDVFVEEIAFRESYNYTRRVLEVSAAYSLLYRGDLPEWPNKVDPEYEDNIAF